jgi:hypothetical protein
VGLQETHSTTGPASAFRPPAGCQMWYSHLSPAEGGVAVSV